MADRVGITIELIGKDAAISGLQQIQSIVNSLNGKSAKVNVDTGGVSSAQSAVSNLFTTVGDVSKGIGGFLSSTSTLMSRTGGMLTRMSNTFGGSILRKASWYAVGKGVRLVEEGINSSISRFDTMRTFPKLMERLGISASKSADIVDNKLNNAVLGLPTALNDIVDSTKQLTMLYGDIDKGSDLAIAANNAFLAAGSDATQVYYGMKQIRDILAKGSLRSMEWDSLFAALGTSTQVVGEAMGYSADQVGEFQTALREGDIEARKFLDALIQVGATEGSELWERAGISKDTISSRLTNIKNAFSILGKNALEAFDQALQENTGGGIPDAILKISDAIKNELSPAVSGWISDNADNVIGFFEKLQSFNWGKLASSVVDNAGQVIDFFGGIVSKIGEDNIIKFVSFAMTWAGPLGKALSLLASPIGIAGMVFKKFGGLLKTVGKFFGKGGGAIGGAGGAAAGMGGFGATFAFLGEIAAIGGLIAEFTKVAEVVAKADLEGFENNIGTIAAFFGTSGLVTGILTTLGTLTSQAGLGGAALAGEGLTAGFEGLIGGVGLLLTQFTKIAEDVSKADLANFETNIGKIGSFLGLVAGITGGTTAGFGILTGATGGIGGLFAGIGTLLTAATIANIQSVGNTISQYVDIATQISDAKFPSDSKMQRVGEFLKSTNDAFSVTIDVDKSKVNSINNALEAVKDISRNLYAFDTIAEMDTDLPAVQSKIKGVVAALAEINQAIEDSFGDESSWKTGEQANIVSNMGTVIDNISKTIPLFKQIQSTIDGIGAEGNTEVTGVTSIAGVTKVNKQYIKDKFQKTVDQVKEVVDGLQEVSNELTPSATALGAWHEAWKTGEQSKIVENYKGIMSQINGLAAAIGATDVSTAGIGTAPQGSRDLFDKKKEQIHELIDGMKGVIDSITDRTHGIPALNASYKAWESSKAAETVTNMGTIMRQLNTLITGTGNAIQAVNSTPLYELPRFQTKIKTLTTALQEIMTSMQSTLQDKQDGEAVIMDWSDMSTKMRAIASSMESVKGIVTAISEMTEQLDFVTTGREGGQGTPMSALASAMSSLKVALSYIPEDADEIQERANNIQTAISSVQKVMESLAGMQEHIDLINENKTDQAAGGIIQSLIGALSGDDLTATTEQISALSSLVGNIGTDLNTLGEVDLSGIASSVQDLYGKLDTLKGSLDNVASALQQVADNAQQADSNINTLASTASGRASSFSPLIGAVSNLAGQLSAAAGAADALTGAINNIPSYKSVTVAYNQVGSPGPASVGGTFMASTGGMVPQYRAFGGTIFAMRPKGSDTVPAMLTPGEFVLRKKAVDTLGVPFLRALNGLNIPAAIDRLTMGLRTPAGFGMVSNDNRRIYNNNQKVNQYISTNNPSYANRRANRYARSL